MKNVIGIFIGIIVGIASFILWPLIYFSERKRSKQIQEAAELQERAGEHLKACYGYLKLTETSFDRSGVFADRFRSIWKQYGPFDFTALIDADMDEHDVNCLSKSNDRNEALETEKDFWAKKIDRTLKQKHAG